MGNITRWLNKVRYIQGKKTKNILNMIFIFQEITPETAPIYLIAYSSILIFMFYIFIIEPIIKDIQYRIKINKEAKRRALKQKEFMDSINKLIKENENY